jgi:hypothetical protein
MTQHDRMPPPLNILDRRPVRILLNAVLFACNFLLIYFLWLKMFPAITGITRLLLCWIGAYAFTWTMTRVTGGPGRLVLAILFLGVLYVVFRYTP